MVRQTFHLVEYRPWPFIGSCAGLVVTLGIVSWFYGYGVICLLFGLSLTVLTIVQWWRDVIREGIVIGFHTKKVGVGLRWGIILFIVSEILFFFSFFWRFFHRRLAPRVELGCMWPPEGIISLDVFSIPLLNTGVLLASGVSVTWSHHYLIEGGQEGYIQGLFVTVLLGGYFTFLQVGEYLETRFRISDRVYGTTFFVATGFHGLHVLIGRIFLFICLLRGLYSHFRVGHHFGFEAAAWYWHFVDVVWIFLYLCIYWWGRL